MKRGTWKMSGILGPNGLREDPNEPAQKGHCIIGDQSFLISGWDKTGPEGKYLVLTFHELGNSAEKD